VISDQLKKEVLDWIDHDPDAKTAKQLTQWLETENKTELERCFAGFLQFGTAGLRGPLGPGPSCMNRAVVSRTAAGILSFMKKHNLKSVIIGRDARHGSAEFATDSAEIFAGGGMKTFVLPRALPTPVLAFAVNKIKADVGIMVTASHNPANDNGYKVYLGGVFNGVNYHGSQIVSPIDSQISDLISVADKRPVRSSKYEIVEESVIDQYIFETAKLATMPNNLRIVYTPLHGVGAETFIKVFEKSNFEPPIIVKEQVKPDPDFPTTAFPNPEEAGAIDLALSYAKENNADLVIANDPDADRCAVAINDPAQGWRMLRGDEVGVLLGHFLISKHPTKDVRIANSLVSSSLLGKIASKHGLEFKETLTGFKWISKIENLLFGYEEALGYCVDAHNVNDKDGISAAVAIVAMVAELKENGLSVNDYLEKIGQEYGFHSTDQISLRFSDLKQIDQLLKKVIDQPPAVLSGNALISTDNLSQSKLIPTPGIRLKYENEIRVIIRPSGTEPKLKCYIEVVAASKNEAESLISQIKQALTKVLT
jgi:phosphomannomutase